MQQKKDRNLSNIKGRVLYLADIKEPSLEIFFSKIGVTSATFKGDNKNSSLKSSTLEAIHQLYPDVNLEWTVSGKDPIFKTSENKSHTILGDNNVLAHNISSVSQIDDVLKIKDELIAELRERISDLKSELEKKNQLIDRILSVN